MTRLKVHKHNFLDKDQYVYCYNIDVMKLFCKALILGLFCQPAFSDVSLTELERLIDIEDFAGAAKLGDDRLIEQPGEVQTQFLTALALQKQGALDRAVVLYESLIKAYPDAPEPKNNLAMIYDEQGDTEKASKLLVELIESQHSYATAYQNLNRIYSRLARQAYQKAARGKTQTPLENSSTQLSTLNSMTLLKSENSPALQPKEKPQKQVEATHQETLKHVSLKQAPIEQEKIAPAFVDNVEISRKKIIDYLHSWISAWNNHQFARYIDHYENGFNPDSISHHSWIEQQLFRLQRFGPVLTEIERIEFQAVSQNSATIRFVQTFQSSLFQVNTNQTSPTQANPSLVNSSQASQKQSRVLKRLQLIMRDQQWKIASEEVISAL